VPGVERHLGDVPAEQRRLGLLALPGAVGELVDQLLHQRHEEALAPAPLAEQPDGERQRRLPGEQHGDEHLDVVRGAEAVRLLHPVLARRGHGGGRRDGDQLHPRPHNPRRDRLGTQPHADQGVRDATPRHGEQPVEGVARPDLADPVVVGEPDGSDQRKRDVPRVRRELGERVGDRRGPRELPATGLVEDPVHVLRAEARLVADRAD
jgi:hypothetical protein